ncbi:uncharacterized protein B0H18DRAFT_990326 [Fomitopsis serialis]|uniref:uncharacterized protein n=1 Tax=Fomitopsis serialis TaxID=139415 RepID=UPI002007A73F|nr:uncharacterized protein B0H18DRAFT_990326 [Neoantrodia serialis]KAH9931221.1 hypothetical protein B0H18DRAFT_990326 [Neoantrodia serialis]
MVVDVLTNINRPSPLQATMYPRTTPAANAEELPGQVPSPQQAHKAPSLTRHRRLAKALDSAPAPTTGGPHYEESPFDVERSPYVRTQHQYARWNALGSRRTKSLFSYRSRCQTTHRPSAGARGARWPISLERSSRRRLQLWANSHVAHFHNCTSLAPSALPYFSTPQPQ